MRLVLLSFANGPGPHTATRREIAAWPEFGDVAYISIEDLKCEAAA